jgi:protein gp37
MATATSIEWTDVTWNPVTGCDKVSPGCAHCYAEVVAGRFWPKQYPAVQLPTGDPSDPLNVRPRQFTDVMTHEDRLDQPLRWKKPRRVFVNSMSDLFHEDVPDAFIDKVFAVMALARQHTFQILTKRAERMKAYMSKRPPGVMFSGTKWHWTTFVPFNHPDLTCWPLPNVWLGVSVENQHFADERIPLLLQTPAAVRFISAEPLLGPVDLSRPRDVGPNDPVLDWVIVGGESGTDARPFDLAWARSIVQQCQAAGVACFVKQFGADPRDRNDVGFEGDTPRSWPMDTETIDECARPFQGDEVRVRLRDRKGGDPSEWPEDLRVRDFPGVPS